MQVVSSKELQERALQIETLKQQCPKHEGVYMWQSVNPCTHNTLTYCPECVSNRGSTNQRYEVLFSIYEREHHPERFEKCDCWEF